MVKRITREQLYGEQGVNLVGRVFLDMGFPWHPTHAPLEAGIDGFVEVRDRSTGEATNAWMAVQVKARTTLERETENTFEFTCTARDLDYWRRGNMPVLMVVARPNQGQAWWVPVKDYFSLNPSRLHARRIVFNKIGNALRPDTAHHLLSLVQAAGAGTYFRPSPRRERLYTNQLEVTRLPTVIYRAQTDLRDPGAFHARLKERVEYPPREWLLFDGAVYSIHDLRDEPWVSASDVGTVETFDSAQWSESADSENHRRFVRLLNLCLRSFAGKVGMRYSSEDDILYFKPTTDLSPRVKHYRSRQQRTVRSVFREYRSKKDPAKLLYFRHVGFHPRFRRFDGRWCLEINPTYLFTSDGTTKHPYHEEYLSKIKTIEGSGAVGGTVVMFAYLLRDRDDLFADNYPHLGFGRLLEAELEVGIDDGLWARHDAEPPAAAPVEDALELGDTSSESDLQGRLFEVSDEEEGEE